MHYNIWQMLLVPDLLSKNSRLLKILQQKTVIKRVFSQSLFLNKNTYVYTLRSEMYAYHTITEELTFCTALLLESIVYQYIKGQ